MKHVDTAAGARELAREILADRSKPLVLVSTTQEGEFVFDANLIARELRGDGSVATIATGDATYELEKLLPFKSHVFNGTARSYPPDFGSDPDWQRSLLRFPGRSNDDLIDDALAQVTVHPVVTPERRTWVRAQIELVSGASGNIARLDSGQRVMVVPDSLPQSLRLIDALVVGEPVEGWLAGQDLAPEPADADFSSFADGTVTLARVVKTTDLRATLSLHPQSPEIVLRRRDLIPDAESGDKSETKVTDVVHVGETVRVRIVKVGGTLGLSLIDASMMLSAAAPGTRTSESSSHRSGRHSCSSDRYRSSWLLHPCRGSRSTGCASNFLVHYRPA